MADNILSTMLYPDMQVEQARIMRQQAIADALRQMSFQPQQPEVVNGIVMPGSNIAGLARLAQGYMASDMQGGIDERMIANNQKMAAALRAQLEGPAQEPAGLTSAPMDYGMNGAGGIQINGVGGIPVQPTKTAVNPYGLQNLIRASAINQISPQMAGVYAKQFETPEAIKVDTLRNISPTERGTWERNKGRAEGIVHLKPNNAIGLPNADGSVSIAQVAPDIEGGFQTEMVNGKPVVSEIQGVADVTRNMAAAKAIGQATTQPGPQQFDPVTNQPMPFRTMREVVEPTLAPVPGNVPGNGLDISKMTPQQLIEIASADPEAFAKSVQRFKSSQAGPATNRGATVLPAGQTQFAEGAATAASKRATGLVELAQDAPNRIAVLDKIIDLSKAGIGTGPTAAWKNNIKGIAADVFGIKTWQSDVAGFQEIEKYMNQNAIRAWQAAGGSGTDSQLEAQIKANVRSGLYPQAVQELAQWNKAGEFALTAKAAAAGRMNLDTPQKQAQFEEAWRAALNPTVYQLKVMPPAEAAKKIEEIKKDPQKYQALLASTMRLKELGGL